MNPAVSQPRAIAPVAFEDGLGERLYAVGAANEPLEVLKISNELSCVSSFEEFLRQQVARLSDFRHEAFGRVRAVERLDARSSTIVVISDHVRGVRLSDVLAGARKRNITLEFPAASWLIRQLVSAVAAMHDSGPGVSHGAISPERLVVTADGRLVVVEYILAPALEEMRFSWERYWRELGIALPRPIGLPQFDQAADVTQVGAVALALLLGRPLAADEYPHKIADVLDSATARTADGANPLPAAIRTWLRRALHIEKRSTFTSAIDAQAELDLALGPDDAEGRASLKSFLSRYATAVALERHAAQTKPEPAPLAEPPKVTIPAEITPLAPALVAPFAMPVPASTPIPMPMPEPVPAPRAAIDSAPGDDPDALDDDDVADIADDDADTLADEPEPAVSSSVTPFPTFPTFPTLPTPAPVPSLPSPVPSLAASVTPFAPRPAAVEPWPPSSEPLDVMGDDSDDAYDESSDDDLSDEPSVKKGPAMPRYDPPAHVSQHAAPPKSTTGRPAWASPWAIGAVAGLIAITMGVTILGRKSAQPAAAATETTGTLEIGTNPDGVAVFIDGTNRGTTPLSVALAPGAHVVELVTESERRKVPVTMKAGAHMSQFLELPKINAALGDLQVRTDPSKAKVTVDGHLFGRSPVTVKGLTPGTHRVLLENESGTFSDDVLIESGATASLVVPMTTKPQGGANVSGWVAINAPADLQVFEGGRLVGSSKTDRIMMAVGRHELEMVNESLGYRSTKSVEVSAGQVAALKPDWPKGTLAVNAQPWAEVLIDGERVGETPIGSVTLPIGPHEIVFRHPELGERRTGATVTTGAPTRVSMDMRTK